MPRYCISDIIIDIDAPEWALHENLKSFLCRAEDATAADVRCFLRFQERRGIIPENSKLIVKTSGLSIYEHNEGIYDLSGDATDIPSLTVALDDWSVCTMLIDPGYNNPSDEGNIHCVREGVFAYLRKIMIIALAKKHGLIIHSSSIIWNNKGILFSAPAGTGKTTHTHIWKQLYNTPVLDGDATACRIINGKPYVYGLPWCGTSGEFMNYSVPIAAIVFLQQAEKNSIIKLDLHEAFIRLASRCFLMPWSENMANKFIDIIQEVAVCTGCYLLNCRPDREAAELVKSTLESSW